MKLIFKILTVVIVNSVLRAGGFGNAYHYTFIDEPIDVVIPAVEKDLETLELCIESIKKNCEGIRDIYVISDKKLSDNALWIDEKKYPFSKFDISYAIFKDAQRAKEYLQTPDNRIGWVLQQLLKLYAPFVIPNISSNVLLVDADTIFLRPVSFLNANAEPYFNPGTEYFKNYFDHAAQLIPNFKKLYPQHSGISHHMIIQKDVVAHLFNYLEDLHHMEAWRAFCHFIKLFPNRNKMISGQAMSEYEIYFNFIFSTTGQAHIRPLKYTDIYTLEEIKQRKEQGYDYVSCHSRLRDMLKGIAPY